MFELIEQNKFVEVYKNEKLGNYKVVDLEDQSEYIHAKIEHAQAQYDAIMKVQRTLIADKLDQKFSELGYESYTHKVTKDLRTFVYLDGQFLGQYGKHFYHNLDTFTGNGGVDSIDEMVKYMKLLLPNTDIHTYKKWVGNQYHLTAQDDRIIKDEGQVTVHHADGTISKY